MDLRVDIRAGAVVGRDDQGVFGRSCILLRNCLDPRGLVLDLMHPSLPLQSSDRFSDLLTGELPDHLLELRVALPHDLVELDRLHARFLQLSEGSSGLDGLMLPRVSDQEHSVVRMEAVHEVVHLLGRCQRTLVQDIEPPLAGIGLLSFGEVHLQR